VPASAAKKVDLGSTCDNNVAMKTHSFSSLASATALVIGAVWLQTVTAQTPVNHAADASVLAPPVNHESGTIDEVLTADDGDYHMRGYIVTWRGSRVFVAGSAAEPLQSGASVDFAVYRSSLNGQRGLRFLANHAADDANVAQDESQNSQVSITSGTAKVEGVLAADNDGYSFVAYLVNWHDKRVAVVDPLLHTPKAVGDQIDFHVFHTGTYDNRQLSFALSP
jgi:hypothetical protein